MGDSQLVAVAESYLKQIDLRQRQVALSVRVLDVLLDNDSQISNSFAFRSGNAFIVSDNGSLLANFGAYKPPGSAEGGLPGRYTGQEGTTPIPGTGVTDGGGVFLDRPSSAYPLPGSGAMPGLISGRMTTLFSRVSAKSMKKARSPMSLLPVFNTPLISSLTF